MEELLTWVAGAVGGWFGCRITLYMSGYRKTEQLESTPEPEWPKYRVEYYKPTARHHFGVRVTRLELDYDSDTGYKETELQKWVSDSKEWVLGKANETVKLDKQLQDRTRALGL